MRSPLRFICLMCSVLSMIGCSAIDKTQVMAEPQEPQTEVVVYSIEDYPNKAQAVPYDDLVQIRNDNSDRDVMLYGLENMGLPRFNTQTVTAPVSPHKSYLVNESVEVYPIDSQLPPATQTSVPFVQRGEDDGVQVIRFDYGQSDITSADKENLKNFMVVGQPISVEGHASARSNIEDPIKRKVANLKISMNRAFNVSKTLIEGGVPAHMIETKAYGDTRPVTTPSSELNQRVEIRR